MFTLFMVDLDVKKSDFFCAGFFDYAGGDQYLAGVHPQTQIVILSPMALRQAQGKQA